MQRIRVPDALLLALPLGFFFLLKSYGLNPAVSDENIYFYDAWLMTRGFIPYRDFFFAHPPFHLIPGWIVMLFTGDFNLAAMKMLPVTAAAVTGICVYRIVQTAAGRVPAIIALSMFFFSHDLLRASSHWTGINFSICWMTLGLLCALRQQGLMCGIFLGLGLSTGVYVVPGSVIIIAVLYAQRARFAAICTAFAVLTAAAINLPFIIADGREYMVNIFLYHSLKPDHPGLGFYDQVGSLLFHNFFLLAAPLYLLPVLVAGIIKTLGKKQDKQHWRRYFNVTAYPFIALGIWCFLAWFGYVLFLSMLSRVYHYYFLLLFPFSAVCAGLFLSFLGTHIRACASNKYSAGTVLALTVFIFAGYMMYPRFEHGLSYFNANKGKTKTYQFPLARIPDALQWPVKRLWNTRRVIGKRYTGVQFYLWHESRLFPEGGGNCRCFAVKCQNRRPGFRRFHNHPIDSPFVGHSYCGRVCGYKCDAV